MTESSTDRAAHRAWLTGLTAELAQGVAVDLGCGRGEDLQLLAARHRSADVQLIGVDASPTAVAVAEAALGKEPRASMRCAPLDGPLPFDDASVDLVYSHNLLECLPSPENFAREVARILRPGGQVVVGHWDWETQLFDGRDKSLVRRLVVAHAEWQQEWMAHADGWMGRRLRGAFECTPGLEGDVHARVLMNVVYAPGCFGYENAQAFRALVRRGLASSGDVERFCTSRQYWRRRIATSTASRGSHTRAVVGPHSDHDRTR